MTQEAEPKKKEPPREKPEGPGDNGGVKLPPPAEAPVLRESAPPAPPVRSKTPLADKLRSPAKSGDLEGRLRSGLILALVIAVGALLWVGLRGAIRAAGSSSAPHASSPEGAVRAFYAAVKSGNAEAALGLVDLESCALLLQGRKFGRLSDAEKEASLAGVRNVMLRTLGPGGETQMALLSMEVRILDVVRGPDVAQVTILSFDKKNGTEKKEVLGLYPQGGSWKIYRLPEL